MGKRTVADKRCIVTAAAVMMLFYGCSPSSDPEQIDYSVTPMQVIRDLSMTQSENGNITMRMEAPLMQRFEYMDDSIFRTYDLYPEGFHVSLFSDDGILETEITSLQARHETTVGQEQWSAFGDVKMVNHPRRQQMESDTVYWDQTRHVIHTDCYVKMVSDQGVMQGYGMESDEKVRDAYIRRPFDSYSVMERDSTKIIIDTLNFIGPLMQRFEQK